MPTRLTGVTPPDERDDDALAPARMRELEATARDVAVEWGVELGTPYALSRYTYVAPAGTNAVLKITPAEDDESDHEADALELWAGDGAYDHRSGPALGRAAGTRTPDRRRDR